MKIVLFVFLISTVFAELKTDLISISMNCPLYSCKPEQVTFADQSVCLQIFGSSYYSRACESGSTCDTTNVMSGRASCIHETPKDPSPRYNGEVCIIDSDCMSDYCADHICKRSEEGDSCKSDTDCNAGQFCYTNTTSAEFFCVPVYKSGEAGCTNDNQCESTCGCRIMDKNNNDKNTCIPYFSLPDYEPLIGCPQYGLIKLICSSGYCWGNTTTSMCIPAPTTNGTVPLSCGDDSACISTSDEVTGASFSKVCNCGYNKDGQSYCNLFSGDAPYQSFLEVLKDWLSSEHVNKCNTDARFSYSCIESYWSEKKYHELKYWSTYTSLYPKVQNSDNCTLAVMFPEYYKLYDPNATPGGNDNDDIDDSSAVEIGLIFAFHLGLLI
ncbi:unnamed protein product [Blepharisma stoltei]|uniref:Uncharacterized protein n=1 Tax=Blepharisma stoltei TaxID=1481888 RepID=A0AAU9IIX0_9CILI|nr:unnamed protein product [Blepharisma stoltei]